MEEHRYADAETTLTAHQRSATDDLARASALLLQARIAFQLAESRRAAFVAREAVAAYDRLRGVAPNDLTLLLRWLEGVSVLRNALLAAHSTPVERQTFRQERDALTERLVRELALAPAYSAIEDPGAIFELVRANCGAYGNVGARSDARPHLRARCTEGAAALEARYPNTYFAQRAHLVGAITLISVGDGTDMAQRSATELPAVLGQVRQLLERDPDSLALLSALGQYLPLMLAGELMRNQGRPSPNSPALASMPEVIALYEGVMSRLTPRDQVSLLTLYLNATQLGLSPESGPNYRERGRDLLQQVTRELPPTSAMRSFLPGFEAMFGMTDTPAK